MILYYKSSLQNYIY